MDAPLVNNSIPPDIRGIRLLHELCGAYEEEEEYNCSWLIRQAKELVATLEQAGFDEAPRVSKLIAELRLVVEFLQPISSETVTIYSYDRAPSSGELLTAFMEGSGADDWALEEFQKKGDKGRRALLSLLKKEKDEDRLLAAVSMLLIVFRDEQTVAAVRRFVDTCDDEIGVAAATLLSAYTSDSESSPGSPE